MGIEKEAGQFLVLPDWVAPLVLFSIMIIFSILFNVILFKFKNERDNFENRFRHLIENAPDMIFR